MSILYIKNATIVNEGEEFVGNVVVEEGEIKDVIKGDYNFSDENAEIIDANGLHLLPGMIDDQVHFREPGLTHKANIRTESRAAVAGGITSFMEMPNTNPQTTNHYELEKKFEIAAKDGSNVKGLYIRVNSPTSSNNLASGIYFEKGKFSKLT